MALAMVASTKYTNIFYLKFLLLLFIFIANSKGKEYFSTRKCRGEAAI